MRLLVPGWIVTGLFLFHGGVVSAQSSLDALQQELNDAKQHHEEVTSETLSNFFGQIDPAMASPDAALNLYAQAKADPNAPASAPTDPSSDSALTDLLQRCGIPPTPVVTEHDDETESEKEARLAQDQANLNRLGAALQLHCGLLHYAALFVVKPDQAGLQTEWVDWLKTAAQIYPTFAQPQIVPPPPPSKKKDEFDTPKTHQRPPPYYPEDIKGTAVRDSVIGKFLAFNAWGETTQGLWTVRDVPKLYRTNVLEPLRTTPTEATLAAWDAYIAMASADERDTDKWNQVDNPPLQFDRACDEYAISPNTEKLEGLVNMIKANPTNPHADDWIARVGKLMDDYRISHGGAPSTTTQTPAAATNAAPSNPNVTVTTEQQGDMTIITTHTNSAPTNPPQ